MKNWILANGNRRISEHDTEEQVNAARDDHNAKATDLNTQQAHVVSQDDYVQQLEAAVVSIEGQLASHKDHMQKLWKTSKPTGSLK